jgi:NAD-dependent dihydropyrimidine dehydrogenase PreA subunit
MSTSVHYVVFSPTGTTQATIQAIGTGTGRAVGQTLDLTVATPTESVSFAADDLVVVGMPVYGGRLPSLAVERFKAIKASGTPVVPIVVYGNRAYGDALLELCDLCTEQGFTPVGAGTFLGQHTFSTDEFPIAVGRPDQSDLSNAQALGRQIQQLLESCADSAVLELSDIPGNRPYKEAMGVKPAATETDPDRCTSCGQCVAHCPTQCIRLVDGTVVTEPDNCIWCLSCVQHCPTGARTVFLPQIRDISERLHGACQERCEPESFLAAVK